MAGLPDSGSDWGRVGAGAASGAAAGAPLGPWGALGGAAVGAGVTLLTLDDGSVVPVPSNNQPYDAPDIIWGGYEGAAPDYTGFAMERGRDYGNVGMNLSREAMRPRMPQVWENQELSDRESFSRGWDQAGSLDLAREAAMGQAPSAAGYQLQQGLDDSIASQQALQGSARGNAGIALAGGNAAANIANMQNRTSVDAARLRAEEMATARGLYGGLAGQMRGQDLERLNMGNQVTTENARLNDARQQGLLGAGANYGQIGTQWTNLGMGPGSPYSQQVNAELGVIGTEGRSYDNTTGTNTTAAIANNGTAVGERNAGRVFMGTSMDAAGRAINTLSKPQTGTGMGGTATTQPTGMGGTAPPNTNVYYGSQTTGGSSQPGMNVGNTKYYGSNTGTGNW